ncbi:Arm DNA-binding domain-containing protein [Methylomonas sp. MO1]|uniref:Arm DNA-binding domain-containing protein n=1 Tax=Methylomonas sp. MO1 TaxID=3073619 RepID=UPI0028A34B2B|nr:Arm DNA-binding domain-containing protein [Methylomonas sp. MO1]MDT4290691.1 Arm DNA-binding domain-containing protein [Methylomonas sp. MO1]
MAVNLNKDTVYRSAKPKDKDYTINDGGGLFLFVGATGTKLWRFVYSFDGKRRKIAFGAYPDTTLENARRKAEEAREQIANSVDPGEIRKEAKAAKQLAKANEERVSEGLPILNSVADITRQWLASIAHLTSEKPTPKKPAGLNA